MPPASTSTKSSKPTSKNPTPAKNVPAKSPKGLPAKSPKSANTKSPKAAKSPKPSTQTPGGDAQMSSEDEDSDPDSEIDSSDEGVDEEALAKLMKALGDKLSPEEELELRNQLQALAGDEESESEDDDEDEDTTKSRVEQASDDDDEELEKEDSDEEQEEQEDADVALDDVDDAENSVDEDAVPQQKIEVDNKIALERIRDTIKLDSSFPWTETLVLSYPETIDVDVNDDLNRELAFYKQALHGANSARTLAAKAKFPFTRPDDYFAEMVKTDAHMERIRQRLLDETAGYKKSDDKRKEREGKKFGKQVQIEKIKEREKSKKEMEERLKGLKRKRGDVLDNPAGGGDDDFDIAVEDAISDRPSVAKRGRGSGASRGGRGESNGPKVPRTARDQKYGFGGGGRRSKSNTKESTDNFDAGPSSRGGKGGIRGGRGGGARGGSRGGSRGAARGGGSKRLGKGRRENARSKTS